MNTLAKLWCAIRGHPYGVQLLAGRVVAGRLWYVCKHCKTPYSEKGPWS
jgi:hypothetical protein